MASEQAQNHPPGPAGARLAGWTLRALMRAFSWLGPTGARFLSAPLGWLLWRVNPRRRHTTRCNLEIAFPELSGAEREELARQGNRHYVRNILEGGVAWYWPEARLAARFDPPVGPEHLDAARGAGRGVILALPHFGAWEILGLHLGPEIDGGILYKPGRNAALAALLLERRSRFGLAMLPATATGLRALYAALRAGRTVGVLPDQEPSTGQGRFAPLFSRDALTAVLIPRLVQKTGARVVFAAAERTSRGRYRAHFLPAEAALYDPDIDTALAALNRGVAACVRIDPPQYLWAYKRWRHRPAGDPPVY